MTVDVFGAVVETAPPGERPYRPLSRKRAAKIVARILRNESTEPEIIPMDFDINGLMLGVARRIRLAEIVNSWPGAGGARSRRRMLDGLRTLSVQLNIAVVNASHFVQRDRDVAEAAKLSSLPSLPNDILSQVQAIHRHFGNVTASDGVLQAETNEVTFDGFSFGKFRIYYEFQEGRFWVEAVTPVPNPASADIVHPHVDKTHLCMGEGGSAHNKARHENRIFDMFVISDRILHTYQRLTAYRAVSSWRLDYHVCCDCGHEGETRRLCRHCSGWLCNGCGKQCATCHRRFCNTCVRTNALSACKDCGHSICRACVGKCLRCRDILCRTCGSNYAHIDICAACHQTATRRQQREATCAAQTQTRPAEEGPTPEHVGNEPVAAAGGEGFFGADGLFGSQARLPDESAPSQSPLYGANPEPLVRGDLDEPSDQEPEDEEDPAYDEEDESDYGGNGLARDDARLHTDGHEHPVQVEHVSEPVVFDETPSIPGPGGYLDERGADAVERQDEQE